MADGLLRFGFPSWYTFSGQWKPDVSHAFFIIVILAAGSFDGLHETFWWLGKVGVNPLEYPGRTAMIWTTLGGLTAAIIGLVAVFAVVVWLGVWTVRGNSSNHSKPFKDAFVGFSITLLPIAIGYHFAHYFVTFLVQFQYVVANMADPMAKGWNLFGLEVMRIKVGFLSVPEIVKIIWILQAGVVVASHVLAVIMSHRTAEILSEDRNSVIKIQIFLSILMIAYTVFGLWLLASPRGV